MRNSVAPGRRNTRIHTKADGQLSGAIDGLSAPGFRVGMLVSVSTPKSSPDEARYRFPIRRTLMPCAFIKRARSTFLYTVALFGPPRPAGRPTTGAAVRPCITGRKGERPCSGISGRRPSI